MNKHDDFLKIYNLCKHYYAESEERLSGMKSYVAPLFEYRSALEHVARWLVDGSDEEMGKAIGHLKRAYFDIVDYISIKVRDEINQSLKKFNSKKITNCWEDYKTIKSVIYNYSEELAKVRGTRGWKDSIEKSDIDRYTEMAEKFLEIHKTFFTEIEPKLRKG